MIYAIPFGPGLGRKHQAETCSYRHESAWLGTAPFMGIEECHWVFAEDDAGDGEQSPADELAGDICIGFWYDPDEHPDWAETIRESKHRVDGKNDDMEHEP